MTQPVNQSSNHITTYRRERSQAESQTHSWTLGWDSRVKTCYLLLWCVMCDVLFVVCCLLFLPVCNLLATVGSGCVALSIISRQGYRLSQITAVDQLLASGWQRSTTWAESKHCLGAEASEEILEYMSTSRSCGCCTLVNGEWHAPWAMRVCVYLCVCVCLLVCVLVC